MEDQKLFLNKLEFGDKFYRVKNRANDIDSLVYCGKHPYGKGETGIIAFHTYDVNRLIYIHLNNAYNNHTYFTDYEKAKAQFIIEAEHNLQSIKEIYSPD